MGIEYDAQEKKVITEVPQAPLVVKENQEQVERARADALLRLAGVQAEIVALDAKLGLFPKP